MDASNLSSVAVVIASECLAVADEIGVVNGGKAVEYDCIVVEVASRAACKSVVLSVLTVIGQEVVDEVPCLCGQTYERA